MQIAVDASDPRPVFRQIVDEVQRCVATAILGANDPLPAVRELAKQLKVNPNTVQQAYRELERNGGAYVRRGVGTFVSRAAQAPESERAVLAKQIAERFLREGFRHGLLASDLLAALQEIAPASARATAGEPATAKSLAREPASAKASAGKPAARVAVDEPPRLRFDR